MTSRELKLSNAHRRQQLLESFDQSTTQVDWQTVMIAAVIAESGHLIAEQICELREAIESAFSSLRRDHGEKP